MPSFWHKQCRICFRGIASTFENRSGHYKGEGCGYRQLKSQGTSKINNICPTDMKVTENLANGVVTVIYTATHWHHLKQLAHLPIPDTVKQQVAAKLQQGVSVQWELDWIQESDGEQLGRQHLVNQQEVYNICKKLNLNVIEKHTCDPTSVLSWVTELKGQEYNPVLFYKGQGEEKDNMCKALMKVTTQNKCWKERENWHQLAAEPRTTYALTQGFSSLSQPTRP